MASIIYFCPILLLSFGVGIDCIEIDVYGQVGFDVVRKNRRDRAYNVVKKDDITNIQNTGNNNNNCTIQYPTDQQTQKLLSYMINELTKVFVRSGKYIELDHKNRKDRRFKTVDATKTAFFEKAFSHMVEAYNLQVNRTRWRVQRAGAPCPSEEQVKLVWQELLQRSHQTLKESFQRCIQGYLELNAVKRSDASWPKLESFVRKVAEKVRTKQRDLLCNEFQLCYTDW